MKLVWVVLAGLALLPAGLFSQVSLKNPGIPAREDYVYQERTGTKVGSTVQTVLLKTEAGRNWYEVSSRSSDSDVVYRVDSQTLAGFYSDITERFSDSTVRRTSEILANTIHAKADELVLSDLNSFTTSLRGFPWEKTKSAKLVFAGSASAMGGFNLELTVQGKETVRIAGQSFECWKLQMGLTGILSGLVPKSIFWYSAKAPHYLVRFEGSRGGMGSPSTILELQSYQSAN